MNDWQSSWLGRRCLPRDLRDFEIEAFLVRLQQCAELLAHGIA